MTGIAEAVGRATDAAMLVYDGTLDPSSRVNGVEAAVGMVYGPWWEDAWPAASAVATEGQRLLGGVIAAYSFALVVLAETKGVPLRVAAAEVNARAAGEEVAT